ncbi:MAG: hypothetical protein KAJ10_03655 [Thermodesulfovibrionia bacterium]|nr:hypothetical protein [Thermodesulfovibrionia bacterium]
MRKLYETDEALQEKIEEYFIHCDQGETVQIVRRGVAVDVRKAIPYTVPDLAYFLGYANRHSINDLKQDPTHSTTIKRALGRIEGQRVRKALNGEQDPRFAQFDLKNNFGYKDTQEIKQLTVVAQLGDGELSQRLALLENKMAKVERIEHVEEAELIDGDYQAKLL